MIEIFDRVRRKVPSKLLLMGDGPERSPAERLVLQKRIHDDVIFLGKQEQVSETLAIADVLLLPSQLESFGLAALEAMASEVVPVATRVGGVPEVIEHGITGFLGEVGDVDAMFCGSAMRMSQALEALASSPLRTQVNVLRTEYPLRDLTIVDVLSRGCSKGHAVKRWAAYRGIPREQVMAIGDNFNDVEMLEYAGLGIAMGNAPLAVQAIAQWVAPSVEQDGAAAAIEAFIL